MPRWRVDVQALYRAVETVQHYRRISARAVAREIGISPSTLTRLKEGLRPDLDAFASIVSWLRADPQAFIVSTGGESPKREEKVVLNRRDALAALSWAEEALRALPEALLPGGEALAEAREALGRIRDEVGAPGS